MYVVINDTITVMSKQIPETWFYFTDSPSGDLLRVL